jgi:hypothetical protein
MILRGLLMPILAATALKPSLGAAQYTPKWQVGDWWIVKVWEFDMLGNMGWRPHRYDVLRVEKAAGTDCFVVQQKVGDTTPSTQGDRDLYYFRTDNYRVVRKVEYFWQAGKLVGPSTRDLPEGMFGATLLNPRLPLFPLDVVPVQDSSFRLCKDIMGAVLLRQFSGFADSVLLDRYLSVPDPLGVRPVQPRGGKMFFALSEAGAPREPGGPDVPRGYSLQLWSEDYPWRLYEEYGSYALDGAPLPGSRSWLVACGRSRSR